MTDLEAMVLVPLVLVATLVGILKAMQIRRLVHGAKVLDEGGLPREMTPEERTDLVYSLTHDRGRHFWHLVFAGVVVIGATWLVLRLTVPKSWRHGDGPVVEPIAPAGRR